MPADERQAGLDCLDVAVRACRLQVKSGNLFLLEHPAGATSCNEQVLRDLCSLDGVQSYVLDQCMYGLTSVDRQGKAPAKKPTRIVTNMIGAERFLASRCDRSHRHVELLNNGAKAAQEYPHDLCKAFIDTFKFHEGLAGLLHGSEGEQG